MTADHGARHAVPARAASPGRESPVCGDTANEETLATSGAEEFVAPPAAAPEPRRLRQTAACMKRALDCYPENALRMINNPVKMKHKGRCLLTKKSTRFEGANTEEC
jgi:hypothetical protein